MAVALTAPMSCRHKRWISALLAVSLAFPLGPLQAQVQDPRSKSPAYTGVKIPEDVQVTIPYRCSNLVDADAVFAELKKEVGEKEAENYGYEAEPGLVLADILPPIEEDPDHPGRLIERPECTQLWVELFRVIYSQQFEERQPAKEHLARFGRSLKNFDPTLFDSIRSALVPPIVPVAPTRLKDVPQAFKDVKFREIKKIFTNSWDPHLDLRDDTDEESLALDEDHIIDAVLQEPGKDTLELAYDMGVPLWMPKSFRSLASAQSQEIADEMQDEDLWRYDLFGTIIKPVIFDSAGKVSIEKLLPLKELVQTYVLLPPDVKAAIDTKLFMALAPPKNEYIPTFGEWILGSWLPRTGTFWSTKVHEATAFMEPVDGIFEHSRYNDSLKAWVELGPKVMELSKYETVRNRVAGATLAVSSLAELGQSGANGIAHRAIASMLMKDKVEPHVSPAAPDFWRFYRNPLIQEMRMAYDDYESKETHVFERVEEGKTIAEIALLFLFWGSVYGVGERVVDSFLSRMAARLAPGAVRFFSQPLVKRSLSLWLASLGISEATMFMDFQRKWAHRGNRSRVKIFWDYQKKVLIIGTTLTVAFVGAEALTPYLEQWGAGAVKALKEAAKKSKK